MFSLQNQNSPLKHPFRTWLTIWLTFSGFLILNQIIIWTLKHQHPSADAIALSLVHHTIRCAIFAWLILLPRGAWWVALSAFLITDIVGLVFILCLEKNVALPPLADTLVTQAALFLGYTVVVMSVATWIKRGTNKATA